MRSTAMSLCVWPCNCYEPSDKDEPDLMWDLDLYSRLDLADAWAIIGPVSWYGPTSNLKLMFDRLVCMNGGNPREDLIDHKDPEKAIVLENSPEWETLSVNHLEGRTAAFFSYTDEGGVEMDGDGCPKILRHKDYFDPELEPFDDMRQAYAPLVWQCLYGGVEVPDALWAFPKPGRGYDPRGRDTAGIRRMGRPLRRLRRQKGQGGTGALPSLRIQGTKPSLGRLKIEIARTADARRPRAKRLITCCPGAARP